MAGELHRDMHKPKSALRLLLQYCPDCVDHLLNLCLVSFCGSEQIQGKVTFDFFLFYTPEPDDNSNLEHYGELTLVEILIKSRKERFLTHPIVETFLKLKWYKTWKMYMTILFLYALFVVSVLGYSLTHFGNVLEQPLDPCQRDTWWYLLGLANSYVSVIEFVKFAYFISLIMSKPKLYLTWAWKNSATAASLLLVKLKDLSIPILAAIILCTGIDPDSRRYVRKFH